MTTHIITVASYSPSTRWGHGDLLVTCSCDPETELLEDKRRSMTLAELNDLADEHIRVTEGESPFVQMLVSGSYQTIADVPPEGYGTKSAITSEDELVDIETGLRRSTGEFYRLP